jgi:tetratricopeptide (TPR) repeat protein
MDTLPRKILTDIEDLCNQADDLANEGQFADALDCYWEAWEYLPEPKYEWDVATLLLGSIGDLNFAVEDYEAGRDNLIEAMKCPGALRNPFLLLRLGQCHFELNELDLAQAQLLSAYKEGGPDVFGEDEPKYLEFVLSKASPDVKKAARQ